MDYNYLKNKHKREPRTNFKAICEHCQIMVEFAPSVVNLTLFLQAPERDNYTFTCPLCNKVSQYPATEDAIAIIMTLGVKPFRIEVRNDPSLNEDDLITFMVALGKMNTLEGMNV